MKKKHTNSIRRYSAIAGSVALAGSKMAMSQVMYTDVSPDSVIIDDRVKLDFNNDATVNFTVSQSESDYTYAEVFVGYGNTTTGVLGSDYVVSALSMGDSIKPSANFSTYAHPDLSKGNENLEFGDAGDKYIGVRFTIDSETHYGWVLVNVTGSSEIIIKEFAYEQTPDKAIVAGDMGGTVTSTVELKDIELTFFPNPVQDILKLEGVKATSYSLLNSAGIEVLSGMIEGNSIDISAVKTGVYTMKIETEEGFVVKQVTKS